MSVRETFKKAAEYSDSFFAIVRVTAEFLKNTGRQKSALALYHECMEMMNLFPQCQPLLLGSKAIIYQDISRLYDSLDNLKKAIKYMEKAAAMRKAQLETDSDAWNTFSELGDLYLRFGDYKNGFRCLEQALGLSEDPIAQAAICDELGYVHNTIGNRQKAAEYINESMEIMKRAGKEATTLSKLFKIENNQPSSKQIPFLESALKNSRQMENKELELELCLKLGNAYTDIKKDPETALKYYQHFLDIAKDLEYKEVQSTAHFVIAKVYSDLKDSKEANKHHELGSAISAELQDYNSQMCSWHSSGVKFLENKDWKQSIAASEKALKCCEKMEELLENEHDLRISLGNKYEEIYCVLALALVFDQQEKRALLIAEKGRTRTLAEIMRLNYGIPTKTGSEGKGLSVARIQQLANTGATGTFVVSYVSQPFIFVWLVAPDGSITLKKLRPLPKGKVKDYVTSMVDKTYSQIGVQCEDRSLPHSNAEHAELSRDPISTQTALKSSHENLLGEAANRTAFTSGISVSNAEAGPITNTLDEFMNASLSDLLDDASKEEKPEELVFAPDGSLCLAPFAAIRTPDGSCLIDKFRVRVIPSITTLNHILSSPADYHSNTGALIVGDPSVGKVQYKGKMHDFERLPFAKKEAEMIGRLLKVEPLTADKATKEEVLKRMGSVSLVHLATHGDSERGEIALAPSPGARCRIIEEKEFLLSMADVLNAKLRAKLVVLSCCHSGRGDIKAEGVVGIARAFLGAGARSVLVSLWAIDDEATLYFMKHFYEGIDQGKSASTALHQATKKMKNSETFNEATYWAPFLLIGDDVHISV